MGERTDEDLALDEPHGAPNRAGVASEGDERGAAGRGGSQLDALFLDEGFGSLDDRNLSDVLDLLEQRVATDGGTAETEVRARAWPFGSIAR